MAAAASSQTLRRSQFLRCFPTYAQCTLLRLRLPPRHPLLHSSSTNARPSPQQPPPPHAAELWIANALTAVAFLRSHHLPAFCRLAPSPLAAAAALRLFAALHSSPLSMPPSAHSYHHVIALMCQSRRHADALQLFDQMTEQHGYLPNILVDGLCRVKEVNRGRELLRRLQRDGICMPNIVTYTSVISGYCKAGRMEDAIAVYNDMVKSGTTPNVVTYNALINGYGKVGDLGSAVAVYQQMMLRRCPPDVLTFSSLIDGYCRCGQLDGAMRIWNEMAQYHIQPNVYTFSIVIHSLCKQSRSEEVPDLLKELNMRADIAPRAFIYNPVIDVLCKGRKVDEANFILMEMEGKGCRPDKYTYTILIAGHCMKGRISEAMAFFP